MRREKFAKPAVGAQATGLHQRLCWFVGAATLVFLLAMLAPPDVSLQFRYFLPLHLLVEFVSVGLALLVVTTVWHTPAKEVSSSFLLIAVAIFTSGWLDFAHALIFKVMPELITPMASEGGVTLWLAARLIFAATLLAVSFYPTLGAASSARRVQIFFGFTASALLVAWIVFFHEAELPALRLGDSDATPMGLALGWFIVALSGWASWRSYHLSKSATEDVFPLLFCAIALTTLSNLLVLPEVHVNGARHLIGHIYKLLSYVLIYQAMFISCVNRPYQQLTAQMHLRRKSDEMLRIQGLALNSTSTPVIVTDIDGHVVWRNRASGLLHGKRASDVEIGSSLFSPPLTMDPQLAEQILATVKAGDVWQGLVDAQDPWGKQLILDRTVTPIIDEDLLIHGYVSVADDVTQKKYAEMRYKRVLDMMIEGFWMIDRDGRLHEVNAAYARMSGYSIDELLTMNIHQLEAPESPERLREQFDTAMSSGSGQFEAYHRGKKGNLIAVDISLIYDPVPERFFVFLRDRTERVQVAAAQKALERQLQQSQKVQELGQLTGGIAHDFNNSLVTILGYSRLALDRFVPDKEGKLAKYLNEVVTASERSRDLVAKMLSFARTQPSPHAQVIASSDVVNEVVNMMQMSIPSSIEIKSWIEDDLFVCIDPGELGQVLVNLIINARDAIVGQGLIEVHQRRVDVVGQTCAASHSSVSGSFAAIEVTDTGSGIAAQDLPRLFDPFFTTKDVGKGTGLGLSMVQGILRRSNGYVLVDSELGQGSQFQLLFPIATAPAKVPTLAPGESAADHSVQRSS